MSNTISVKTCLFKMFLFFAVVELGQGDYNKEDNDHHLRIQSGKGKYSKEGISCRLQTKATPTEANKSNKKLLRKGKPNSGKKSLKQNRSCSASSLHSGSAMSFASSRSVGSGRNSRMSYSLDMLSDRVSPVCMPLGVASILWGWGRGRRSFC